MRYPNLEAEMVRHGVTQEDLATTAGTTSSTISRWLSDKTDKPFPIESAMQVKSTYFPDFDLEYLFSTVPLNPKGAS